MADETKELSIERKIVRGFCLLLLASGIILLLTWGLIYGIWWDIGLYTILLLLIVGGGIGTLLYSMPESEGETGPK